VMLGCRGAVPYFPRDRFWCGWLLASCDRDDGGDRHHGFQGSGDTERDLGESPPSRLCIPVFFGTRFLRKRFFVWHCADALGFDHLRGFKTERLFFSNSRNYQPS